MSLLLLNKLSKSFATKATTAAAAITATTAAKAAGIVKVQPPHSTIKDLSNFQLSSFMKNDDYLPLRKSFLSFRRGIKSTRQVEIGPYSSLSFLNYDILWIQIQEMLLIEKGGEEQAKDEIFAYQPLLPQRNCLKFNFLIEIDEKGKRAVALKRLVGIENKISLIFQKKNLPPTSILCKPIVEEGVKRETEFGRTSAMHFMSCTLPDDLLKNIILPNVDDNHDNSENALSITAEIKHPSYMHTTVFQPKVARSLREDLLKLQKTTLSQQ